MIWNGDYVLKDPEAEVSGITRLKGLDVIAERKLLSLSPAALLLHVLNLFADKKRGR